MLLVGIELVDLVDRRLVPKKAAFGLTLVLLLLESLSMREFKEFNYVWKNPANSWTEARRMQQVLSYLKPGCWDVPICTGGIEGLVENPETIFTVDGKYCVYVGADRALLKTLHCQVPD